ncbi:MAG: RNA polymerase sigma factor [Bacteroidota bacterium]|jgi:RNA polymerase sigma-70 factor (ECF subfamily)
MNSAEMSEKELIEGCIRNHPAAQEALFKRFSGKMLAVCCRYTANKSEAEDILQDGFIKVFQKLDLFRGDGSLEGWIKRIMVNTALDLLRRNKKLIMNELGEEWEVADPGLKPGDSIQAKDLMLLIQTLPNGFRTVFNLYAIEGYSHKEIGDLLGISESTSKSQYSRARAQLQKLLATTTIQNENF